MFSSRSGIRDFVFLVGIVLVTGLVMALSTPTRDADLTVLGLRVVSIGGGWAWLAVGGKGLVTLGAGVGLVSIGLAGAGLLFAVGQGAIGLIAFAQMGVGVIFFGGQAGLGLVGMGQGVGGLETWYQGNDKGKPYIRKLNAELGELLAMPFFKAGSRPRDPQEPR